MRVRPFLLTIEEKKDNLDTIKCKLFAFMGAREMSHLHIPDGVLSPLVWISGYIITFTIMFYLTRKMDKEGIRKKIPFTGIAAAIMLLAMSIPLGFLPAHLSLASLVSILLGPSLGFLAVFSVNLILALVGHGGITLVGLNTLIIGGEVLISSFLFRKVLYKIGMFSRTFISVAVALGVSISSMILVFFLALGSSDGMPFHLHSGQASLLIGIIILGIFIESMATSFIIKYFEKVRPDIISK